MAIQFNVSSRGSAKRMDLSSLPATHVDKGAKGLGIFLMIFALIWGGVPTAALIAAIASGKVDPGMYMVLIFTLIGVGMFVAGLGMLFSECTTVIDAHGVKVTKKSLFGTKHWSERISAYQGVLSRSEYHSGGKNSPSYTLYIVELRHAEPAKTVRLYESRSDDGFRGIWEDYCRQLSLPAVEVDGKSIVRRDVEDLDKTLKDLVKEGKVKVDFDPSKPPPGELSLRVDAGVLELTVVKKKGSPFGYAIALLIPGIFVYIGFFMKGAPIAFGILGLVFLVLVAAGIVWSRIARDQIRIGRDEIRKRQLTPWGATDGEGVRSAGIETVRIGKKDDTGYESVLLESDSETMAVGGGLSMESLEWLKQCIMKVISS